MWCLLLGMSLTWLGGTGVENPVISWIPFAQVLKGNPWANSEIILLKVYFIGAMVFLLQAARLSWGVAASLTSVWLLALLMLQRFATGQTADMTDIYMVPIIGWAMFLIARQASDDRNMAMH